MLPPTHATDAVRCTHLTTSRNASLKVNHPLRASSGHCNIDDCAGTQANAFATGAYIISRTSSSSFSRSSAPDHRRCMLPSLSIRTVVGNPEMLVIHDDVPHLVADLVRPQPVVDAQLVDELLSIFHRVEANELDAQELDSFWL